MKIRTLALLAMLGMPLVNLSAKMMDYEAIKIREIKKTIDPKDGKFVEIKGMIISSSYVFEHIKMRDFTDTKEVNFVVDGTLVVTPTAGKSDRFSLRLPLTKNLDKITYGPDRIEIWTRHDGD